MPCHHFADRMDFPAGNQLQLGDEGSTESVLPRELSQLVQFANRPESELATGENLME